MRFVVLAGCAIALAGCAMSSKGLGEKAPRLTMQSAKPPQEVAVCVAEAFQHAPQLRNLGEHYWVTRLNGYGFPVSRWDFKPTGSGGTSVEARTTIDLSGGGDKVKACL